MVLDAAVVAIAVRTTARISAVLLSANLIGAARRLSASRPANPNAAHGSSTDLQAREVATARTRDIATFAAFLVSHTIHFASVALLALATDGVSIDQSGGWPAAMIVAAVFYLSVWSTFRGKRRTAARWTSAWQRRREVAVLTIIWLIFFLAFSPRFQQPLFAVLAVGLACSLGSFLIAARRVPADSAGRSIPASV
jgi:hypothetical protein